MLFLSIFILVSQYVEPALNPHLDKLVESIRHRNLSNSDSYWNLYLKSLVEDKQFSEHTHQLAGLTKIREHETKFVDNVITEAEFCHRIGLDFTKDCMCMETEWFLEKAESLGLVNIETYLARAQIYAREWNNILHYNDDLSDTMLNLYETKWRESLLRVIETATDSIDIDKARLELLTIYGPWRTPLYVDHFAPEVIHNLEEFIDEHPQSRLVNQAYERLVWWLYTTGKYEKLIVVCKQFFENCSDSPNKEYIKFQLGNAYYFLDDFNKAKAIYVSIEKDSFPESVYPGWGSRYILEAVEARLDSIGNK